MPVERDRPRETVGQRGVRQGALIAANGLYARLYRMNYASFDDIPPEELERALSDGRQRT